MFRGELHFLKQQLKDISEHSIMSYELDLIATSEAEFHEQYRSCSVRFVGFRFRLECRSPLIRSNGILARWSALTRGIESRGTRREFARERSNALFHE